MYSLLPLQSASASCLCGDVRSSALTVSGQYPSSFPHGNSWLRQKSSSPRASPPSHPWHLLGHRSAPQALLYLPGRCSSLQELRSPSQDMNHAEGTRHGSCCHCLPLGKGGVNGRKYRGKRIKTEQMRFLSCLAWGSCSFPWLLFLFQLLQF